MKQLSHNAFERARQFIKSQARPLERALFEHRFESAPAERVVVELEGFRNDDGGFGHALEPDLRTPTSSALATGIALRILKEVHCPADHPMVEGNGEPTAVSYEAIWQVLPGVARITLHEREFVVVLYEEWKQRVIARQSQEVQ